MIFQISLGSFYGLDSIIDFLIVITALLIGYQSHKIYTIIKEKNYQYFSWAFLYIGIAFLFKILSNITMVHKVVLSDPNLLHELVSHLKYMQIFYFTVFSLYKVLLVVGFLVLFMIITKTNKKENVILFLYLSALSVLLSVYFNFVFHLTLVLIQVFLCLYFYDNYESNKSKKSFMVFIAFVIILLSNFLGVIMDLDKLAYLVDEILLLAGFSLLLYTHLRIKNDKVENKFSQSNFLKTKNDKEKNKTRDNKRPSGNIGQRKKS